MDHSLEFVLYDRYTSYGRWPEKAQVMYVDDTFLTANHTPILRKRVGMGVGGGHVIFADKRPMAFRLLKNDDLLDTTDLCRIFGCSARTVYRWITHHSLRPFGKIGREFLFTKGELMRWFDSNDRPAAGRPSPG